MSSKYQSLMRTNSYINPLVSNTNGPIRLTHKVCVVVALQDGCDFVCRTRSKAGSREYRGIGDDQLQDEDTGRDDSLLPMWSILTWLKQSDIHCHSITLCVPFRQDLLSFFLFYSMADVTTGVCPRKPSHLCNGFKQHLLVRLFTILVMYSKEKLLAMRGTGQGQP